MKGILAGQEKGESTVPSQGGYAIQDKSGMRRCRWKVYQTWKLA
jgi:hypothetical protein